MIDDKAVEIYNRLRDELRRDFERLVDEYLGRSNVDEKVITSMVKAIVGKEIARLKAEVEELGRQGVDVETIKRLIDEVYNRLLNDVRQIVDQRIMHVLDAVNEQSNSIKDVLDLVNEVHKFELAFEEELAKLRDEVRKHLNEETLEEVFYKMLIKRGIIRKRRKRWILPIIGGGILAGIVIGLIINPAITFVTIAMAIAVLLRW